MPALPQSVAHAGGRSPAACARSFALLVALAGTLAAAGLAALGPAAASAKSFTDPGAAPRANSAQAPVVGRVLGAIRAAGKPQPGVRQTGPVSPSQFDGDGSPVLYWGGPVMGDANTAGRPVHLHVIFWEPAGTPSSGTIAALDPNMKSMIEQYLTDVSTASESGNVFAVTAQYGDTHGTGSTQVVFDAAKDVFTDSANKFPNDGSTPSGQSCPLPVLGGSGNSCYTDLGAGVEVANAIAAHNADPANSANQWAKGLNDLYILVAAPAASNCFDASATVCSVRVRWQQRHVLRLPLEHLDWPDPGGRDRLREHAADRARGAGVHQHGRRAGTEQQPRRRQRAGVHQP